MADRDILAVLAEQFGLALGPLERALQSQAAFTDLMDDLGWELLAIPDALASLQAPLATISELLDGGSLDAGSLPGALHSISSVLGSVQQIGGATGLPGTVDPGAFTAELPRQLVDYLLVEYLLTYQPVVGQLLKLLGVIRLQYNDAAGKRPAFVRRAVAWEDLARVLSAPQDVFVDAYRWGQDSFDQEEFGFNVADAGQAVGLPVTFDQVPDGLAAFLQQGATALTDVHDYVVRLPLLTSEFGPLDVTAGVGTYPLPGTAADKPGFAFLPYVDGDADGSLPLSANVSITFEADVDADGGIGILVRPGGVSAFAGILSPPTSVTAVLALGLAAQGAAGAPMVLAGSQDASRLEVRSASVKGGVRAASSSGIDAFAEIALQGARMVVKPAAGDSDGFLATLLPADGLTVDLALGVGISSRQGIYFGGSSGLEIQLPVHVELGPIEIDGATIQIRPANGEIPITLGATIKGELGPLQAVVENVGLRVDVTFPATRDGNLGVANVALGFKPPNGVGLSIDAGVVKGGGYLFLDPDAGEYAGAIELTIADFLSVKAIGLITTKNPDGSPGFSLLVIISAEFGAGIQLGYGFTLIGVGGLLGLNRTMKLDALMQGVATGAIAGIMFPQDIVANAPRIISDLKAIFPPQENTFLIGPFAKLGWMTPTLISLSLGVIIEIPGNVAIVGVLQLALPDPDDPVLVIQANFAGALEFDRKRGYFFAALFDSRILTMTLDGQMGALVAFGDDANLLVSVGGFHPSFTPPPLPFPSPKRITISILDEDDARIRADTYFAATTNTVQFGAGAELYFGFGSCSVQGHFAFDALLQFSPIHLVAEVSASVSLKAFGVGVFSVGLDLRLEGPTPWHVHGTASVSILFFSISATIDQTFGIEGGLIFPLIELLALVQGELQKPESWVPQLPPQSSLLVTLRPPDPSAPDLVLHPLGSLRVSQKAVPLELGIARVGQQRPKDANRFSLDVAGGGLAKVADATQQFAAAQFLDLSDADRLARPPFEAMPGGIELAVAGRAYASAHAVARVVRYDEVVIDTNYRRFQRSYGRFPGVLWEQFLAGNAASLGALSGRGRGERLPFGDAGVVIAGETYVVAGTADNAAVAAPFGSEAAARDHLQAQIDADPRLAGSLHVIPAYEAVAA